MRKFGLIGFPLSHSFSEKYFTEKFQRENIADSTFTNFPLEHIELLTALLKSEPELCGLSVTIPYKEKVIPFLHEIDPVAKQIGAVNCIRISRLQSHVYSLKGYNTDTYGFRQSLKPFLESKHERALILGTGGASKAVEYVLREIGIDCLFVSREKKALPGKNCITYAELNKYILGSYKLVVNCSPVGTFPNVHDAPAIPYECVTKDHFLYDLVYNPAETAFLKRGKEKGALVMNGFDMLKLQAEKAWEIWTAY